MAKQIIVGGMSDLGIVSPDDVPKALLHTTITGILKDVEAGVTGIITDQRAKLEAVVAILLEKESISGNDFRALLAGETLEECA